MIFKINQEENKMLLHPTVQELTSQKHVNRYTIVIATAKGARYLVDKENREREEAQILRETNPVKDSKSDDIFERECEKPVSEAVRKIDDDEFKIIVPSETPTK